jgi:hypothetical protein
MVFVEDLNLVGLSRAMLGKHCLDAGFGQFFNILEQTCFKRGVFFQKVDAKKTRNICPIVLKKQAKKSYQNEFAHVIIATIQRFSEK